MNSGGAHVSQANHSQLANMLVKGQAKGASAASPAGSLLAILPGAVVKGAQGFGNMLQQLRVQVPGLGKQTKLALSSPGNNRTVVVAGGRVPGMAKPPVLATGETNRLPNAEDGLANHIAGPLPGGPPTAALLLGGEAGRAGVIGKSVSKAGSGTTKTTGPTGKRALAGASASAQQAQEQQGVASGARSASVKATKPSSAAKAEQLAPQQRAASGARSASVKATKPSSAAQTEQLAPHHRATGKPESRPLPSAIEQVPANTHPSNGNVSRSDPIKAALANNGAVSSPNGRGPTSAKQAQRAVRARRIAGSEAASTERIQIQPRLDGTPSPSNRVESQASQPGSGRIDGPRPAAKRQTRSRVSSVRTAGTAHAGASKAIDHGGSEIGSTNSLTTQDGLRPISALEEGKGRGFVKPESVGVLSSDASRGDASPAPLQPSLPAPVPATVSAGLASLVRLTTLHYSRFIAGDQRSDVFAFDGGSLGKVQLTFQENQAGTTLSIVVDSSEVRQMLQRALPQIEQQLAQQGLDFSDVSVAVEDGGRKESSPRGDDPASNPAESSDTTDEVGTEDDESSSIKDYGYNTVEFVA